MITPFLEKLILTGKASYHTYVVGGSEKVILNVPETHYIIITGFHYNYAAKGKGLDFDVDDIEALQNKFNTQMKIFSAKSSNTYTFRDAIIIVPVAGMPGTAVVTPQGGIHLDSYLIHDSDVSFTFTNVGDIATAVAAISDASVIANPPPSDYGHDGQPGALAVREVTAFITSSSGNDLAAPGGKEALLKAPITASTRLELISPVDIANRYLDLDSSLAYPIVNVEYVSIQGILSDILGTT